MTQPTRSKEKQEHSELIEQQTAEFLARGGKIQREEIGTTKTVDLTWRNYAGVAFDKFSGEEEE